MAGVVSEIANGTAPRPLSHRAGRSHMAGVVSEIANGTAPRPLSHRERVGVRGMTSQI
ncbi:hypothetical protein BHAOGJBA_4653 [Methylobacterium hispanicum]|jgi:hypothetical protein|uniref:Uncharacterized protein n=1 Tax=Methylobacterium hispanicum TaxID=270350 RepID=A0AAV4ZTF8_9HYPH|nr:hypothetical protein BHAOGJBA_4653 [Methylobacterium hispanicum]